METLVGPKLYKDGKMIAATTTGGVEGKDLVMMYFGSLWERDCKTFFPHLLDFYKLVAEPYKLECIYISNDRNAQQFKEIFAKMPWLAIATGTASYKNHLAKTLKILECPTVIVFQASTGLVITTMGKEQIEVLPKGKWEDAYDLVDRWRVTQPIPMDQVQMDDRLRHGNMARGTLYWSG
jgi:thiol-disulfide isomerase/thioredoxin